MHIFLKYFCQFLCLYSNRVVVNVNFYAQTGQTVLVQTAVDIKFQAQSELFL